MHLSRGTLDRMLHCESPHVRRRGADLALTIVCTVEEGGACRFAAGDWDDPVLDSLLARLIEELGWKSIEHCARREVVIRCTAPDGDSAKAVCEADTGSGFEPLSIRSVAPPED